MRTTEIYLTKKNITSDEWLEWIKTISVYNGIFRKWKIILKVEHGKMRYYAYTHCVLPTSINHHPSFLMKRAELVELPSVTIQLPFFAPIGSSFLDVVNKCEANAKGNILFAEVEIRAIAKEKVLSTIYLYIQKGEKVIKYKLFLGIASSFLATNFEENLRFLYQGPPKYIDCNKIIPYLKKEKENSILEIDSFPYVNESMYLTQTQYDFAKHSILFGASGSGKSKFISSFIYSLYTHEENKQKYKVVVIDPHASLENDIGGIGKVIDFKSIEDSIDLFMNQSNDVTSSTELLVDLFKNLIADLYNSKVERVLRHSVYMLLTGECLCFTNIKKLLLDLEYRTDKIRELEDKLPNSVVDFFLADFNELKAQSYTTAISPIISFIDEMEMIPVFNEEKLCHNLEETIKDNFLTVFSLDRLSLGDKATKTIAGLIMQQMLTLIQKMTINEHILFVIDEVAVVENPILCRFLSEARKFRLSLFLAGQYFSQISTEVQSAIFANVSNYYLFRVSKQDAIVLKDIIDIKIPLEDTEEKKEKALAELKNRECVIRISSNETLLPACKAKTLDFKSIPRVRVEKQIEEIKKEKPKTFSFTIGNKVSLKDILKANSTARKVG